jgi:hypothetical protein
MLCRQALRKEALQHRFPRPAWATLEPLVIWSTLSARSWLEARIMRTLIDRFSPLALVSARLPSQAQPVIPGSTAFCLYEVRRRKRQATLDQPRNRPVCRSHGPRSQGWSMARAPSVPAMRQRIPYRAWKKRRPCWKSCAASPPPAADPQESAPDPHASLQIGLAAVAQDRCARRVAQAQYMSDHPSPSATIGRENDAHRSPARHPVCRHAGTVRVPARATGMTPSPFSRRAEMRPGETNASPRGVKVPSGKKSSGSALDASSPMRRRSATP